MLGDDITAQDGTDVSVSRKCFILRCICRRWGFHFCVPSPLLYNREIKFSGANADREIFIFPVQPTTTKIGNLTRLVHTLAICVTIHMCACVTIQLIASGIASPSIKNIIALA